MNREPVGEELGIDYSADATRDFFAQGNCDEVFLELIKELGWMEGIQEKLEDLPPASAKLVRNKVGS